MRTLIVSMNITLDGFLSGPNNELGWHFDYWCSDLSQTFTLELCKTGTVLMGRVTFNAMAKYWNERILRERSSREDLSFALAFSRHEKVVYSNTMSTTNWNNSHVVSGDLNKLVNNLKSKDVKRKIIVYGSTQLVKALIKLNLVDEFHLWVHPVTLVKGQFMFDEPDIIRSFQSLGEIEFVNGVVLKKLKAATDRV